MRIAIAAFHDHLILYSQCLLNVYYHLKYTLNTRFLHLVYFAQLATYTKNPQDFLRPDHLGYSHVYKSFVVPTFLCSNNSCIVLISYPDSNKWVGMPQ